jgi:hypothetical protein
MGLLLNATLCNKKSGACLELEFHLGRLLSPKTQTLAARLSPVWAKVTHTSRIVMVQSIPFMFPPLES